MLELEEIGQELFQSRDFKDYLSDVAISFPLSKAASCGDTSVKVHDMNDLNVNSPITPLSRS